MASKFFREAGKRRKLEELKEQLQEHPYFKRTDMAKPVFVKVLGIIEKDEVEWKNQYTSSKLGILDFADVHQHLTDEDEILEAMDLLGD